jgi:hypothetical protein
LLRWGIIFASLISLSTPAGAGTPLNSSIILFSQEDSQQCIEKVDQALQYTNKSLLFLVTLYFVPARDEISSYCSMAQGKCARLNPSIVSDYENSWKACFKHALESHVGITIVPHLDDGGTRNLWRNRVRFDPEKNYDDFSYGNIMIRPLVRALAESLGSQKVPINFYLEGEMGASLFAYPESYLNLFREVKSLYPDWNVGLSLNFNNVDGNVGNQKVGTIRDLLDITDFIGISAYRSLNTPILSQQFENNVTGVQGELTRLNVHLAPNKIFQFTEVGLGGGFKNSIGELPATSPEDAAGAPWSGITYPYSVLHDPWQNSELKELREQFHRVLLDFLDLPQSQTSINGAYLWNSNSWDPQGLREAAYKDSTIVKMIESHNSQPTLP